MKMRKTRNTAILQFLDNFFKKLTLSRKNITNSKVTLPNFIDANALITMLLKTIKYDSVYNGCFMTLSNIIYRNVYLKSFPTSE